MTLVILQTLIGLHICPGIMSKFMETPCFHCGDPCPNDHYSIRDKTFCCLGCKTVFELLSEHDMDYYYELVNTPGSSPSQATNQYDYLDNQEIVESLLDFNEANQSLITLRIPTIHCSSCIWVLEHLNKLHTGILQGTVNFPAKTVQIRFNNAQISLKEVVVLLSNLGYPPAINADSTKKETAKKDRSLIYKLGIAGFAFGNVMFLSFPEYFDVDEFWLEQFKFLFRGLMLTFAIPVVFYAGWGYFKSAIKGLRSGILNIDLPIAIGISVLFLRSTIDVVFNLGSGFFDSLTGLVFFLLLGKFFQQKTYNYLSFERDYKSFFPIGVTRLHNKNEEQIPLNEVAEGDRLLIRNNELIPVDATLKKGQGFIDYSFVTGEAAPVLKQEGDSIFAGGKQQGGAIEVLVTKAVEQSYLTQLWSNEAFISNKSTAFTSITDSISKRFTITILSIAVLSGLFWVFYDPNKVFNVITAVLIVACPCAIALSAPFTLGNLVRIFGQGKCYVKNSAILEQWSQIDTVIFDKTGTLTTNTKSLFNYHGMPLTVEEQSLLYASLRASNHALSRALYSELERQEITTPDSFQEYLGKGISASKDSLHLKFGAASFVSEAPEELQNNPTATSIHISSNSNYKGHYVFKNHYRNGILEVCQELSKDKQLVVLSGDNNAEAERLEALMPNGTPLLFNQKPEDKLKEVRELQRQGKKVMMIGDGLNDAGAMAQSNIGIAVAEDINVFTPACDAIIDAKALSNLNKFFMLAKRGRQIIIWCFVISLIYNLVGLSFAVSGNLSPVVAAILMPLSSISIVIFTWLTTQWYGRTIPNNNSK